MNSTFTTRSKINNLFLLLEADKKLLLEQVSHLSEEKYYHQPKEGKWSVAQILMHLLTVERMSILYMKKKSLGIDKLKDSGILENIKILLLKVYQQVPVRQKAPKVIVENTPSVMPYSALADAWASQRNDLKNFIDTIENRNLKKKMYKHVIAGRLDIYQALVFFKAHLRHHWPQINRLVKG